MELYSFLEGTPAYWEGMQTLEVIYRGSKSVYSRPICSLYPLELSIPVMKLVSSYLINHFTYFPILLYPYLLIYIYIHRFPRVFDLSLTSSFNLVQESIPILKSFSCRLSVPLLRDSLVHYAPQFSNLRHLELNVKHVLLPTITVEKAIQLFPQVSEPENSSYSHLRHLYPSLS